MTSQIAVFNLECVAVASDSILTLTTGKEERTLSTSEKIFDLGVEHRVIVMMSGEARFMKVPWTVLISEWKRGLTGPLPTRADYARHLCRWLLSRLDLFPLDAQNSMFRWQVRDYYLNIRARLITELEASDLAEQAWDDVETQAVVRSTVDRSLADFNGRPDLEGIDATVDAKYLTAMASEISEDFEWVFDDVPRTVDTDARLLAEVPALVLAKNEPWAYDTTIALIGYGSDEVFPGHQVMEFHAIVNGAIRAQWWEPAAVHTANTSLIAPFAQTDAIDAFVRAYDRDFLRRAHQTLDELFDEHWQLSGDSNGGVDDTSGEGEGDPRTRAHQKLEGDFEALSWDRFVSPMLATVDSLPRADMARMAESLVGVQALRAASMTEQPSVGGPIDVVVISREHGVEWLRRKSLDLA